MNNKPHTVLVVEDDLALRTALVTKLQTEGYNVLAAKDGKDGLNQALASKPDMILLDIVMPLMDGLAVAKALSQDDWGKNANIIILSNLSDNQQIAEAVGNGVYEYIIKSDKKLEEIVTEIRDRFKTIFPETT